MNTPTCIVYASGTAVDGGTGFEAEIQAIRAGVLNARIACVISNHAHGGVRTIANRYGIPFEHFPAPWNAQRYQGYYTRYDAEYVMLLGWMKRVVGIPAERMINVHPGPLPLTEGLYKHLVHERVLTAYARGDLTHTTITLHYVTEDAYDAGPVLYEYHMPLRTDDTPDTLAKRVQREEHRIQPIIAHLVMSGAISWSGHKEDPVNFPPGYVRSAFHT